MRVADLLLEWIIILTVFKLFENVNLITVFSSCVFMCSDFFSVLQ